MKFLTVKTTGRARARSRMTFSSAEVLRDYANEGFMDEEFDVRHFLSWFENDYLDGFWDMLDADAEVEDIDWDDVQLDEAHAMANDFQEFLRQRQNRQVEGQVDIFGDEVRNVELPDWIPSDIL